MKTKERISRTSIQESLQQKKVLPEMTSDVKIRRDFKVELVALNHCFFKKNRLFSASYSFYFFKQLSIKVIRKSVC